MHMNSAVAIALLAAVGSAAPNVERTSPTDDFCPTGTCWHNGISDGVFACVPCDTNGKRDAALEDAIKERAFNCDEPLCWVPGPADDILNGSCVPCNANGGGSKRAPAPAPAPEPVEEAPAAKRTSATDDFCPTGTCWHNGITDGNFACVPCDTNGKRAAEPAPVIKRTSATDDFCPTGSCWHNGIQDGIIGYCEPCSTNGKRSELLAPHVRERALNCNEPLCWVPGPTNDILNGKCVPCNSD